VATRWLFGDQLGPHFVDDHDGPLLLVESRRLFAVGRSTVRRRSWC
jgi:deoxyribodipyrimidine photolyase-related protein